MREFDVVVVGSGPGGYVAAIRAAQLGLGVAVVEKDSGFGGTCLNVGCIPTKVMIHSADLWDRMDGLGEHGIVVAPGAFSFDMARLHKRKDKIVAVLAKGIASLFKKNKVTAIRGEGAFVDGHTVRVTPPDGPAEDIAARFVVVATGSVPKDLPHIKFGGPVVSSAEMLKLDAPPKNLVVIGAGAVGVEFACVYAALGSCVTVVEMLPRLLPAEDETVSDELEKSLKKKKIKIMTNSVVEFVEVVGDGAVLTVKGAGGDIKEIQADKVLLAVGRAPYTRGLGVENAGIITERGYIAVDEFCRTGTPHIYAVGDVIPTPQLAHVASAEGVLAANHMAGREARPIDYRNIPSCTYSNPQVGSTGMTEKRALAAGYDVKTGVFPFLGIGKARIEGSTEGFVKLVTDRKTGEILGAHMVGAISTELVSELSLAIRLECTAEELALAIHPHPTLSEAVMEAAHAAHDMAVHA